jgi:predicted nucleic acid-binding protein
MEVLVDSGVLLRAFDRSSSDRRSILRALRLLRDQGHSFVTTHQNIAEFWNVATRPASARGGFGLSPIEAERRLATIEGLGRLLPFNQHCYSAWRQLLVKHGILGVSVHDARLVATMTSFGITHVLTLNAADFKRYSGIVAWVPTDVV